MLLLKIDSWGAWVDQSVEYPTLFFLNVHLFILRETARQNTRAGWGREIERHRIQSRLRAVSTEPDARLELTEARS